MRITRDAASSTDGGARQFRSLGRRRGGAAKRAMATTAALGLGALLLAACGSSTTTSSSSTNPSSIVHETAGGTVTWAEQPGAPPNYIFPFVNGTYFNAENLLQFQYLMVRPLYGFGNGEEPTLNTTLSVAQPPVFKDSRTVAVVNLKHYKWSDGERLDARDVLFWMNMMKTEKQNWAAYVPGAFPDNITNVVASGPYQVTFDLNKSYNPTWFTYNELSQITPMPAAWDVTSSTAKPGSGGCAEAAYASVTISQKTYAPLTAGARACNAVYDFLSIQAGYNPRNPNATNTEALTTYASNPLWQVVDGPWRLLSFNDTGRAVFAPNKSFSGKKPLISRFIEVPFTSAIAEYNALVAGAVDVGYLPSSEVLADAPSPGVAGPNNPSLTASYDLVSAPNWSAGYFATNLNSNNQAGATGKVLHQLYVRQAIQSLVDQPLYVKKIFKNYAVPTYGPVPILPDTWASPTEKRNPYPYDPARARKLLTSHGWKLVPGGVSVCSRPGSGPSECGVGIPSGAKLEFNLQFASGIASLTELMDDEAASWEQAGIKMNLSQASYSEVVAHLVPCPDGCSWDMEDWGGGWTYVPDYYPTGGEIFATGAGSNWGGYSNTINDLNIALTHTSTSKSALYRYQNFLALQIPDIMQPVPLQAVEVQKRLNIGAVSPFTGITPELWYFTRK